MEKSYFGFEQQTSLGEVVGTLSNITESGGKVYAACNESVLVWDLHTRTCVKKHTLTTSVVTCIANRGSRIAIGYQDGSIRVIGGDSTSLLEGHSTSVICLAIAKDGFTLASGSNDTTVILWDLVQESRIARLQGHKDAVVGVILASNCLISASRDSTVKFWDARNEFCYDTQIISYKIVSICKVRDFLIVGTSGEDVIIFQKKDESWENMGTIARKISKRFIKSLAYKRQTLLVQAGSFVEFFRRRTDEELEGLLKKRKRRHKEKKKATAEPELTTADRLQHLTYYKATEKISSCALINKKLPKNPDYDRSLYIAASTTNSLSLLGLRYNSKNNEAIVEMIGCISGHVSPVRALALGSATAASCSGDSIRLWDLGTKQCTGTLQSDYCLCAELINDDRFLLVGTKSGKLYIYDILSMECVMEKQAHDKEIWRLISKDNTITTCSSDKTVRFWQISRSKKKQTMTVKLVDTFNLNDEALDMRYTPNGKQLAVALLDSTIGVFYADSRKFMFSLYAHKLPVTSIDISDDSALLASVSSDKTVKIWGMDYGNCHKSLIAHEKAALVVRFVPETHFFFTAGKDGIVKYWDGDAKSLILQLQGHCGDIWDMIVSSEGDFIMTTGSDLSLRIWAQTEDMIFPSEEKEREETFQAAEIAENADQDLVLPEESLKSGDLLLEALDVVIQYRSHQESGGSDLPPPHFANRSSSVYILHTLQTIRPTHLDTRLQMMPYTYVVELFSHLNDMLPYDVSLVSYCTLYLLDIHEKTIISSQSQDWILRLRNLQKVIMKGVTTERDRIGMNLAGLRLLSIDN